MDSVSRTGFYSSNWNVSKKQIESHIQGALGADQESTVQRITQFCEGKDWYPGLYCVHRDQKGYGVAVVDAVQTKIEYIFLSSERETAVLSLLKVVEEKHLKQDLSIIEEMPFYRSR